MSISRINSKEEYLSSIRMNISRINHLGIEEEYPLRVRVNISRINYRGEIGITTTGHWVVKLAEIYPNVSHARTYNRVVIELYLSPKGSENIDKTRGKEIC